MKSEKKPKEDKTDEKTEEKEEVSNQKQTLVDKIKEDPWKVSTVILGVVCLIFLFSSFSGLTGSIVTGSVVNEETAGNALLDFANQQGANAELVGVEDIGNFYEVILLIDGEEAPFKITKDGKFLAQLMPLSVAQPKETETTFTEEQNILIQDFSSCLYENGMRVYYAGWCSACHKFIEIFGGLENMGPMMIECQTESRQSGEGADLCAVENINAFPTIKINGEKYSGGSWAFEALGEATGCVAPKI